MDIAGLGSLDLHGDRPVYKQIADQIRAAILAGQLQPGELLPSEADLMQHYQVARATARQATSVLKTEGIAVAEHGRGLFVGTRRMELPADVLEFLIDIARNQANGRMVRDRAAELLTKYQ